jgi:signal transduction histidine kinase
MFFRTRELEVAHEELQRAHADLQERQQVVEILSNRMAEERQDERSQVAAYLHDDVAQLLFRLSLQIDIARRRIRSGDYQLLDQELAAIRETKEKTNERVRGLIRDLDRSPLGPAGLAEALRSFTEDAGRGSGVSFGLNIDDLPLPPPIQLLVYHISREAVMNALKHAGAAKISISLVSRSDHVELCLEDDGVGFDSDAAPPEGHFGMTLMRERAKVAGGTFIISSTPGEGTTIRVEFPSSWLDQEQPGLAPTQESSTSALDPSVNASYKQPAPR